MRLSEGSRSRTDTDGEREGSATDISNTHALQKDSDEGGGVDAVMLEAQENVAKTASSLCDVIKKINTLNEVKITLEEEEMVHVTQMAVYCGAILKARDVHVNEFFTDDGGAIPEVVTVTGVVVESDQRARKE